MANENIRISNNNFCLGPQIGTICTVDTTNPQTVLKVKDTGGSTIMDLYMSSNILTEDVRLEYAGPNTLTGMVDDLSFFTFEKVNDTTCVIKRWQTRIAYRELLLKEQIVKSSAGLQSFNTTGGFAVEYYNRTFALANPGDNNLVMNSVDGIKSGTRFFVGPSSDSDNVGATEQATVSHITDEQGLKVVYLTKPLTYQYTIGDSISFYNYVYVYCKESSVGDDRQGSLVKLDAYNWNVTQKDSKAFYKRITAAKWCPQARAIASVVETNMLFVKPYSNYTNWRSLFLRNVSNDKHTTFPVHDVAFDGNAIYKLQERTTRRDDDGVLRNYLWADYNIQEDTLAPYSSSMATWMEPGILTGHHKSVAIKTQVRDQYHVGLRDVLVNYYKDGDPESRFEPFSGFTTTDSNGKASVNYVSGTSYFGHTNVQARATGSSNFTGSEFVWGSIDFTSMPYAVPSHVKVDQVPLRTNHGFLKQLSEDYMKPFINVHGDLSWHKPYFSLWGQSFFSAPGGNWGSSVSSNATQEFEALELVKTYLPQLYQGDGRHTDAPLAPDGGYGFETWPWYDIAEDSSKPHFIGNRITITPEFESFKKIKSVTNFYLWDLLKKPQFWAPYVIIFQPDESGDLQISQLKLSLHTHWVDGLPQDELWTYDTVDQFIFVEDAIPKFWSSKNPIETNVWLRVRPFAFSLNNDTLRMWVRVISYLGDTGYQEITNVISITNFDAGGGLLGIEVLYDPPQDFPHGAQVIIRVEVYDTAYTPNFVFVEYWWNAIPDYKAPYLTNLSPGRGELNVPVDTQIYFEVKDDGTGVDLSDIEFLLNSRMMDRAHTNIEVVSDFHIKVTYTPPSNLYFSKDYKVTVKASDFSPQENTVNDAYVFYTVGSELVFITDPKPGICKRGLTRFEDVSAVVLADGNGVDKKTIRMQVFNKDVHPKILPIIYRVG